MADRYTHGHHDSVLRSHRGRDVANSAAYLLPHLDRGKSLLDVGCGPGSLTADLARRVDPGPVIGVDRAEAVLAEARASTDQENVRFTTGDVYALPFADASFDIVHAHQVLQHLTDPVAALREMSRVCRPDGIVAVRDADYHGMTWWPPEPALDRWMEVYQSAARANGAEPDAGRRLLSWALEAGLRDVVPSASVWCFATQEDRAWWGGMWSDRILTSDLAGQAVAEGHATEGQLGDIAEGWRRWAAARDGWFSIVHGEVIGRPG